MLPFYLFVFQYFGAYVAGVKSEVAATGDAEASFESFNQYAVTDKNSELPSSYLQQLQR